MDIQVIEDIKEKLQVVIKCRQIDDEIIRLKYHIEMFDQKLQAKKENEWCFINLFDVLCFESVDNRTILATMCNGERLFISRKYVPAIRSLLSVWGGRYAGFQE